MAFRALHYPPSPQRGPETLIGRRPRMTNPYAPKVTTAVLAEVRRLRESGHSYTLISRAVNVSSCRVGQLCRAMGIGGLVAPRPKKPAAPGAKRATPGYDGWVHCTRISTSERAAIRAEHAAGATIASLSRRFGRHSRTVRRVVGLTPYENRTHLHYLFDLNRPRTALDRAVDEGLCALTPGYRRVVDLAEAEYGRRAGR